MRVTGRSAADRAGPAEPGVGGSSRSRAPALATLGLLVCLGALFVRPVPAMAEASPGSSVQATLGALALALVNEDRRAAGMAPLVGSAPLAEAAQQHAEDMAARGYLAHVSPTGNTAFDRYVAAGGDRWQAVAENIGLCGNCGPTPDADGLRRIHAGWIRSAAHRDNILARDLTQFGFGIAADDAGKVYAVEMFAGPSDEPSGAQRVAPGEEVARFFDLINRDRVRNGVRRVRPRASLNEAASRALAAASEPLHADDVLPAVRQAAGGKWRSIATIIGVCGGCGSDLTAADVDTFYARWMNNPDYRAKLMSPDFAAGGFAMRAGADGRKIALSLIGVPLAR